MIKVILNKADGSQYDITKIINAIKWSGDYKSCARKLEFSIMYKPNDKNIPKIDIPLSSLIIFYENDKELFRGFVFDRSFDSNSTSINFVAFDYAERLNKIKVSYNIKNKTADEVMRTILKDYGIKVGNDIARDSVKISKLFLGSSIYETIMTAYTEQGKVNGKKYMIYAKQDTICSRLKGHYTLTIGFEEGKNIISSTFSESIGNMVNRVVIVDDKGNKKSEVKDDNLIKIHGLFQEIYKEQENKDNQSEAKAMLNGIEKTCSLSGFGDTSCVTGFGVKVKDSSTGLTGLFYIDSDTHTWEGNKYTIDLQLNFRNIMDEQSAGSEEQDK